MSPSAATEIPPAGQTMTEQRWFLSKAEFKKAASEQASRLGLAYDSKNLDKDYAVYFAAADLLDDPELVAQKDQNGRLRLFVMSAHRSMGAPAP
jgi:hypothetical protein